METNGIKTQARSSFRIRPAYWVIAACLLLITLAGCLTSHAAGPPELEQSSSTTGELVLPTYSPTATTAAIPGVTTLPNLAAHVQQTVTPTTTATVTPTVAPDTSTPTPTNTPAPTTTPAPTATTAPLPTNTPRPTEIPATAAPFQAYAWLDNYYPAPGSVVTVHGRLFRDGRPANGAQMGATWSYTHGEAYCTAYTSIDGRAACAQNIGVPLVNYWVYVDVVFVYKGELYYAKTSFLPDP